jgi:predicted PurR-regulated permease PerM
MNNSNTDLRPEKSRAADKVAEKAEKADKVVDKTGRDERSFWDGKQSFFIAGIFTLLLIAFLYLARSLVAPIVAAVIVSIMFSPLAIYAARLRIPSSVFAAVVVGAVLVALNVGLVMLGGVVSGWAARGPEIAAALKAKAQFFEQPIAAWRELQISLATIFGTAADPPKFELSAGPILAQVLEWGTPAVGQLVLFFGMLFFLLLSRDRQRRFLVLKFESQDNRLRALKILNEIEESLTRYVKVVSVVNIGVGLAAALIAFIVGLPNPILWGAVAAMLNFIPYVGPAIVVLLLFVLGVVSLPTLPAAFLAPAMFVAFATVEGHLITPSIIGRHLTLSPLATFVSLAFWTWLWGPLGTFLATPFLIAAFVVYNHTFAPDEPNLPG